MSLTSVSDEMNKWVIGFRGDCCDGNGLRIGIEVVERVSE